MDFLMGGSNAFLPIFYLMIIDLLQMEIKLKKLAENAVMPAYATNGDACVDFTATRIKETDDYIEYGVGWSMEIPEGYFGLCRPRSSVSKYDLQYATSGIIDSGYRGEIMARFVRTGDKIYQIGDRILQMVILPHPVIEFIEVHNLTDTDRGTGGHGSTGR